MPLGRSASCNIPLPRNKLVFEPGNNQNCSNNRPDHDTNMCRTTTSSNDSKRDAKLSGRSRSNSMPLPPKLTPKTSRRVIFPTLYESQCQSSPLFKNQKREFLLGSQCDSKLYAPFTSPLSLGQGKPQMQRESLVKSTEFKSDASGVGTQTSSPAPPQNPTILATIPDRKLKSGELLIEKSLGQLAIDARKFKTSRSLSSLSDDNDNDDGDNDCEIASTPRNLSTPKVDSDMSHGKLPFSDTSYCQNIQESPTSIVSDLHRRIQPGPSILKKKSISNITPTSTSENPLTLQQKDDTSVPQPTCLTPQPSNDVQGETTSDAVLFCKEKHCLRKSLSESCIHCLKKFSSTPDQSSDCDNVLTKVSSSPSLPLRSKTEHDDRAPASTKPLRRFSWNFTRHFSHEEFKKPCKKRIRFDPRVWVHEVQKCAADKVWYNESELQSFKSEAIQRIRSWTLKQAHKRNEMIPTGTGRIITRECRLPKSVKAFYTNPALSLEAEEEEDICHSSCIQVKRMEVVLREIQNVLLVDCHDIFLCLLSKDIKSMMPHVVISTAYTVKESLDKIEKEKRSNQSTHGFDLIVVEHRLKQVQRSTAPAMQHSGAALIQHIAKETYSVLKSAENSGATENDFRFPLVIGMSAYMDQDETVLKESGSDMVWTKPPPKMNDELRDKILHAILKKRRRKPDESLGFMYGGL